MAFSKKAIVCAITLFLATVINTVTASNAKNYDCNGKSFYCLNSTHFMICVDFGEGISRAVEDFVIPCPQPTVCTEHNDFECEFPAATTTPSTTTHEETPKTIKTTVKTLNFDADVSTNVPFLQGDDPLKSEKYTNIVDMNEAENIHVNSEKTNIKQSQPNRSSDRMFDEGFILTTTDQPSINEEFTNQPDLSHESFYNDVDILLTTEYTQNDFKIVTGDANDSEPSVTLSENCKECTSLSSSVAFLDNSNTNISSTTNQPSEDVTTINSLNPTDSDYLNSKYSIAETTFSSMVTRKEDTVWSIDTVDTTEKNSYELNTYSTNAKNHQENKTLISDFTTETRLSYFYKENTTKELPPIDSTENSFNYVEDSTLLTKIDATITKTIGVKSVNNPTIGSEIKSSTNNGDLQTTYFDLTTELEESNLISEFLTHEAERQYLSSMGTISRIDALEMSTVSNELRTGEIEDKTSTINSDIRRSTTELEESSLLGEIPTTETKAKKSSVDSTSPNTDENNIKITTMKQLETNTLSGEFLTYEITDKTLSSMDSESTDSNNKDLTTINTLKISNLDEFLTLEMEYNTLSTMDSISAITDENNIKIMTMGQLKPSTLFGEFSTHVMTTETLPIMGSKSTMKQTTIRQLEEGNFVGEILTNALEDQTLSSTESIRTSNYIKIPTISFSIEKLSTDSTTEGGLVDISKSDEIDVTTKQILDIHSFTKDITLTGSGRLDDVTIFKDLDIITNMVSNVSPKTKEIKTTQNTDLTSEYSFVSKDTGEFLPTMVNKNVNFLADTITTENHEDFTISNLFELDNHLKKDDVESITKAGIYKTDEFVDETAATNNIQFSAPDPINGSNVWEGDNMYVKDKDSKTTTFNSEKTLKIMQDFADETSTMSNIFNTNSNNVNPNSLLNIISGKNIESDSTIMTTKNYKNSEALTRSNYTVDNASESIGVNRFTNTVLPNTKNKEIIYDLEKNFNVNGSVTNDAKLNFLKNNGDQSIRHKTITEKQSYEVLTAYDSFTTDKSDFTVTLGDDKIHEEFFDYINDKSATQTSYTKFDVKGVSSFDLNVKNFNVNTAETSAPTEIILQENANVYDMKSTKPSIKTIPNSALNYTQSGDGVYIQKQEVKAFDINFEKSEKLNSTEKLRVDNVAYLPKNESGISITKSRTNAYTNTVSTPTLQPLKFICGNRSRGEFRRKKKNCDSDEVYHKRKKKCVDEESYECKV
ncbi:unnamed protein product [Leptosia nina]|uniref:Uncharacterized protein n=1 Tax=Leptosia nina TaxID=320188 RepID=A0AAV1JT97_9NEOP